MTNPTDTNQASEDELRESIDALLEQVIHIGYVQGYNQLAQMAGVAPYNHIQPLEPEEAKTATQSLIRNEKLKLLAEVRERVIGEDEKLVIPDYPKTDDEGEPLYSKRAAKEGRKQVTARYHTRKELRNDQRTELTKLEAEL